MVCENKREHTYKAYKLNIRSEIFLPEFVSGNSETCKKPDVFIAYGKMPKKIEQAIQEGKKYHFEKNEMWFSIDEVGIYYIYNGNTIMVEPYEGGNKDHLKIFLLGSAFGMLLLQRNNVAIHGSTVVIDGKGVIFTGNSGAGKSTLAVTLRENGCGFLADDISAIDECLHGNLMVKPGFPIQKLCKDTAKKMGYNVDKLIKVNDDRDKYAIYVGKEFIQELVPLGAVFELSVGEVKDVQISKIVGSEKLKMLIKNIFMIDVTRYSGIKSSYFKTCVEIANKVPFYRIVRPKNISSVNQQIELITECLRQ